MLCISCVILAFIAGVVMSSHGIEHFWFRQTIIWLIAPGVPGAVWLINLHRARKNRTLL